MAPERRLPGQACGAARSRLHPKEGSQAHPGWAMTNQIVTFCLSQGVSFLCALYLQYSLRA